MLLIMYSGEATRKKISHAHNIVPIFGVMGVGWINFEKLEAHYLRIEQKWYLLVLSLFPNPSTLSVVLFCPSQADVLCLFMCD